MAFSSTERIQKPGWLSRIANWRGAIAGAAMLAAGATPALAANAAAKDPTQLELCNLEEKDYSVQKGDTVWGIAKRFNSTPATVVAKNPSLAVNPDLLRIGQQLKVPASGEICAVAETPSQQLIAQTVAAIEQAKRAEGREIAFAAAIDPVPFYQHLRGERYRGVAANPKIWQLRGEFARAAQAEIAALPALSATELRQQADAILTRHRRKQFALMSSAEFSDIVGQREAIPTGEILRALGKETATQKVNRGEKPLNPDPYFLLDETANGKRVIELIAAATEPAVQQATEKFKLSPKSADQIRKQIPFLKAALIWLESLGDEDAVSSGYAIGRAGLIPSNMKNPNGGFLNGFNEAESMQRSMEILADLMANPVLGQDLDRVMAAYGPAGTRAVLEAINKYGEAWRQHLPEGPGREYPDLVRTQLGILLKLLENSAKPQRSGFVAANADIVTESDLNSIQLGIIRRAAATLGQAAKEDSMTTSIAVQKIGKANRFTEFKQSIIAANIDQSARESPSTLNAEQLRRRFEGQPYQQPQRPRDLRDMRRQPENPTGVGAPNRQQPAPKPAVPVRSSERANEAPASLAQLLEGIHLTLVAQQDSFGQLPDFEPYEISVRQVAIKIGSAPVETPAEARAAFDKAIDLRRQVDFAGKALAQKLEAANENVSWGRRLLNRVFAA